MEWRVARSLDVLKAQLDALYPNRSKISDGSIGDAAHASRKSDHNPDAYGIVRARDFTHDPDDLSGHWLAGVLTKYRDPRIKYIIWNSRIWYPGSGWQAYYGPNPHTKHLHLSVVADARADETRKWTLSDPYEEEEDMTKEQAAQLDQISARVEHLWTRYRQGIAGVQGAGVYAVYLAEVKRNVAALKEENTALREELGAVRTDLSRLLSLVEGLQ